jgi:hypothetical protein
MAVYNRIKESLEEMKEGIDLDEGARQLKEAAAQFKIASREDFGDEGGQEDTAFFNEIAEILFSLWPKKKYLPHLDDKRVQSMVRILQKCNPTPLKIKDLLILWQKFPASRTRKNKLD